MFRKYSKYIRLVIDADNYRERKLEALKEKALKLADDVAEKNKKAELSPMNASERRVIHQLFQEDDRIRTYSVGNGNNRRIVLAKRGNGPVNDENGEDNA